MKQQILNQKSIDQKTQNAKAKPRLVEKENNQVNCFETESCCCHDVYSGSLNGKIYSHKVFRGERV